MGYQRQFEHMLTLARQHKLRAFCNSRGDFDEEIFRREYSDALTWADKEYWKGEGDYSQEWDDFIYFKAEQSHWRYGFLKPEGPYQGQLFPGTEPRDPRQGQVQQQQQRPAPELGRKITVATNLAGLPPPPSVVARESRNMVDRNAQVPLSAASTDDLHQSRIQPFFQLRADGRPCFSAQHDDPRSYQQFIGPGGRFVKVLDKAFPTLRIRAHPTGQDGVYFWAELKEEQYPKVKDRPRFRLMPGALQKLYEAEELLLAYVQRKPLPCVLEFLKDYAEGQYYTEPAPANREGRPSRGGRYGGAGQRPATQQMSLAEATRRPPRKGQMTNADRERLSRERQAERAANPRSKGGELEAQNFSLLIIRPEQLKDVTTWANDDAKLLLDPPKKASKMATAVHVPTTQTVECLRKFLSDRVLDLDVDEMLDHLKNGTIRNLHKDKQLAFLGWLWQTVPHHRLRTIVSVENVMRGSYVETLARALDPQMAVINGDIGMTSLEQMFNILAANDVPPATIVGELKAKDEAGEEEDETGDKSVEGGASNKTTPSQSGPS